MSLSSGELQSDFLPLDVRQAVEAGQKPILTPLRRDAFVNAANEVKDDGGAGWNDKDLTDQAFNLTRALLQVQLDPEAQASPDQEQKLDDAKALLRQKRSEVMNQIAENGELPALMERLQELKDFEKVIEVTDRNLHPEKYPKEERNLLRDIKIALDNTPEVALVNAYISDTDHLLNEPDKRVLIQAQIINSSLQAILGKLDDLKRFIPQHSPSEDPAKVEEQMKVVQDYISGVRSEVKRLQDRVYREWIVRIEAQPNIISLRKIIYDNDRGGRSQTELLQILETQETWIEARENEVAGLDAYVTYLNQINIDLEKFRTVLVDEWWPSVDGRLFPDVAAQRYSLRETIEKYDTKFPVGSDYHDAKDGDLRDITARLAIIAVVPSYFDTLPTQKWSSAQLGRWSIATDKLQFHRTKIEEKVENRSEQSKNFNKLVEQTRKDLKDLLNEDVEGVKIQELRSDLASETGRKQKLQEAYKKIENPNPVDQEALRKILLEMPAFVNLQSFVDKLRPTFGGSEVKISKQTLPAPESLRYNVDNLFWHIKSSEIVNRGRLPKTAELLNPEGDFSQEDGFVTDTGETLRFIWRMLSGKEIVKFRKANQEVSITVKTWHENLRDMVGVLKDNVHISTETALLSIYIAQYVLHLPSWVSQMTGQYAGIGEGLQGIIDVNGYAGYKIKGDGSFSGSRQFTLNLARNIDEEGNYLTSPELDDYRSWLLNLIPQKERHHYEWLADPLFGTEVMYSGTTPDASINRGKTVPKYRTAFPPVVEEMPVGHFVDEDGNKTRRMNVSDWVMKTPFGEEIWWEMVPNEQMGQGDLAYYISQTIPNKILDFHEMMTDSPKNLMEKMKDAGQYGKWNKAIQYGLPYFSGYRLVTQSEELESSEKKRLQAGYSERIRAKFLFGVLADFLLQAKGRKEFSDSLNQVKSILTIIAPAQQVQKIVEEGAGSSESVPFISAELGDIIFEALDQPWEVFSRRLIEITEREIAGSHGGKK